ncbi:MAG TPA: hypothetical protein VGS21_03790 [Acidimicrobiales bacterium]|nr:hypothetical protein [Acidimicrobiales bacterium]
MAKRRQEGDVIDLLEYEDRLLVQLLDLFGDPAAGIEEHEETARLVVEHLSIRENARAELATVLEKAEVGERAQQILRSDQSDLRRELAYLDEITKASPPEEVMRQELDEAVAPVEAILRAEIPDELTTVIPAAKQSRDWLEANAGLPSAARVAKRAKSRRKRARIAEALTGVSALEVISDEEEAERRDHPAAY